MNPKRAMTVLNGAAEKEADIGRLLVTGIADVFLKEANLSQQPETSKDKNNKNKKSSNRKIGSPASTCKTRTSCNKACSQVVRPRKPSVTSLKQQKVEFASRYLRDPFAESVVDLSLYITTLQCITENRDISFKALAWEVGTSEIETVCILRKARREKQRHAEYFHEALDLWSCVDTAVTVRLKKFKAGSNVNIDEGAVGTLLGRAVDTWSGGRGDALVDESSKKRRPPVRCVVDFGRTIAAGGATAGGSAGGVDKHKSDLAKGADVDTSRVVYLDVRQLELTDESRNRLRPGLRSASSPAAGAATTSEHDQKQCDVDPDFKLFLRVWRAGPALNLKQIAAAAGISFGKAQRLLRKAKQLDQEAASSKNFSKCASVDGRTDENGAQDDAEYLKNNWWPFNVEPDFPQLLEYEDPLRVDAMHFASLNERFMLREVQTKRSRNTEDPKAQQVWMQKPLKSEETVSTNPNGVQTYFTPIDDDEVETGGSDVDETTATDPRRSKPRPVKRVVICAPGTLENPIVAGAALKKTGPQKIEWVPAESLAKGGVSTFALYGHAKSILFAPCCTAELRDKLIDECAKMEHTLFDSFMYDRLCDTEQIRMSRVKPLRIMCTGRLPPGFENFRNFFEAGGTLQTESDFLAAQGGFLTTEAYMMDCFGGGKTNPGYTIKRVESVNAKGEPISHWVFVRDDAPEAEKRKALSRAALDQIADLTPNPGDLVVTGMEDEAAMLDASSEDSEDEEDEDPSEDSGIINTYTSGTARCCPARNGADSDMAQHGDESETKKIALATDHQGISAAYTRYDAYMKAEAENQRGLKKRLAREEKRKHTPATIAIGPKGEAVTLPKGVTGMKSFIKVNTNTPENADKSITQLLHEYKQDAKAQGAGGAGDDSSGFRNFADEHIEVSYSLPAPEAGASPADFAFEQFLWRCIEDGRTDLTSEEAACSLFLEIEDEDGSTTCSSRDVIDELCARAESGDLAEDESSLVLPWIRDPKILKEQKKRAEEIRKMWEDSGSAAGCDRDLNDVKKPSKKNVADGKFRPSSGVAGIDTTSDDGAQLTEEMKVKDLQLLHNEASPAARVVSKFLKKRMKFRHTMRGINELRRQGLLNVDKIEGGKAGVKLRTTVRGSHYVLHGPGGSATVVRDHKGNVQKTGTEIMKTLKRIAFVAGGGGGSSRVDSPSDVAGGAGEGLTPLWGEKLAQMLADGRDA